MATTTAFGWPTPDDTSLVKDGAAAIRSLGQAIDTSMAELEGGTTGQVLSKTSNTDMDFTWVTPDDANAIQNAIVDAKGDLIAATAADTPARLAVGTNGQVLTADSTASTGLAWATATSGGMTLLSTTTLSGASTTVSVTGGYNDIKIVVYGMTCGSNGYFYLKPNNSASISTFWTAYMNGTGIAGPEARVYADWSLDQGYSYLANNSENISELTITQYANTSTYKTVTNTGRHVGTGSQQVVYFANGCINTTSAITSLVFTNTGGNLTGGTVLVYGVK